MDLNLYVNDLKVFSIMDQPPPKNVERVILEYVDCKKDTIFFKLTTC
jgi:hypothetical protein